MPSRHPIRIEVAAWAGGKLRTLAYVRQRVRAGQVSLYVHIGGKGNEWIHSFHASGQKNLKLRRNSREVFRVPNPRKPEGKNPIRQLWTKESAIAGRRGDDLLFLKRRAIEDLPESQFAPEVVFEIEEEHHVVGLTFHLQDLDKRSIPYPHRLMSTGFSDRVLPPLYVLLNYGGFSDYDDAANWRTGEPAYDDPPRPSYCRVADKAGYFPLIWHPSTDGFGMEIRLMSNDFGPPAELADALASLPIRQNE